VEALRQQTHSLPIVFVQVSDPVKLGVVANLARPGGNITGFTNFEHAIGGKWLELIRDTAPGAMRVLVIFEPDLPGRRPSSNWSSISKLRRHSGSLCRSRCLPAPVR
jgi:ABC-type uncharacterized transport system substrate-binding protein